MECSKAAAAGNLDLLKQLRQNGSPWNEWTCVYAARNGHLNMLQWARKNGCPWDKWTCAYAAWHGHLEILQWAREHHCSWDWRTCACAAQSGSLAILRWAIANGCDHKHTQIDKTACVERGVFPGYGCLVAGCPDKKSEGLCNTHKAAVRNTLQTRMCNDTTKLVLEIVCALN